jgi:hypothetical protein
MSAYRYWRQWLCGKTNLENLNNGLKHGHWKPQAKIGQRLITFFANENRADSIATGYLKT